MAKKKEAEAESTAENEIEIKFDKRNYRIHNDKNKALIAKSLDECGAGRSILIDADNEIIAGNGVYEQAKKKGLKVRVVETDGTDLIAVKRTDLKPQDIIRKQLAVMDNSTSDNSVFDFPLLQTDFSVPELKDFGVLFPDSDDVIDVEATEHNEESKYTRKITVPIYEIKGEKPTINQMIDTSKADELIKKIEKSELPEISKEFLKKCATRLYEFRYDYIAEYYAHADKNEQELMEKLALVIIDFEKAIENGYVELNKFIENTFMDENGIKEQ